MVCPKWLRVYFAEGTTKDTAVNKFKTAFPANIPMVAGGEYEVFTILVAKKTCWSHYNNYTSNTLLLTNQTIQFKIDIRNIIYYHYERQIN